MAKKTKTTNVTSEAPATILIANKSKKAKASKTSAAQAKPAKTKKLSALDAAAKVLSENGQPMTSRQMIEEMSRKGQSVIAQRPSSRGDALI
jgi:hypothetical protein